MYYPSSGKAIAKSSIATNRRYKDKSGEQREETCFIDIVFFGKTAETAHTYLKKGAQLLIDGRLSFEQWTDKDGHKRSRHYIIVEHMQMLGKKPQTKENQ